MSVNYLHLDAFDADAYMAYCVCGCVYICVCVYVRFAECGPEDGGEIHGSHRLLGLPPVQRHLSARSISLIYSHNSKGAL